MYFGLGGGVRVEVGGADYELGGLGGPERE